MASLLRDDSTEWMYQMMPLSGPPCLQAYYRNVGSCSEPVRGPEEFTRLPEHAGVMQVPNEGGFHAPLWDFIVQDRNYMIFRGREITVANPAFPQLLGRITVAGYLVDEQWDVLRTNPSLLPPGAAIGGEFGYFYQILAEDVSRFMQMEECLEDATGSVAVVPVSGGETPKRRPVIVLEPSMRRNSSSMGRIRSERGMKLFRHPCSSFAHHLRVHLDTLVPDERIVFDHNLEKHHREIVRNLAREKSFEFQVDQYNDHTAVWNFAAKRSRVRAALEVLEGSLRYPPDHFRTPVERQMVYVIASELGLVVDKSSDTNGGCIITITRRS